jgi:hypothetical protein
MARAAGSSHAYSFRLMGTRRDEVYEIDFPSVTHIAKSVKDAFGFGGMAWWGYKIGIRAAHPKLSDAKLDELYEALKETPWTPNKVRDDAGERGTGSHDLAEQLALGAVTVDDDGDIVGPPEVLAKIAGMTVKEWGNADALQVERHMLAARDWWLANQDSRGLLVERPVWSVRYGYCGTMDLAREIGVNSVGTQLEVIDYKSHKPSEAGLHKDGSYTEGLGPAYIDDMIQESAYGNAVEELGLGTVMSYRTVLFGADGKYREDTRSAPFALFLHLKAIHDEICPKPSCGLLGRAYARG